MCPVTGVSFQFVILQEEGLQAVSPGPRGAEGQAGDTAQVRVPAPPAAQPAAPSPSDTAGSSARAGACTQCCGQQCCRDQTWCLHPK